MKKIIYTSLFLLSLVFLGSRSANAATLYQQTDYSSGATYGIGSGQSRFFLQSLGQVTSTFTLGKISFRYNSTYSGGGGIRAITCDNLVTDMSQCTNFVQLSTAGSSGGGQDSLGNNDYLQYLTYSTTTIITAGKYLYVGIGSWGQNLTVKLYGSVANTYANGQCLTGTGVFNGSTGTCSTINDAYFIVTDQYGQTYPPVVTSTTLNPAAGTFNVVGTWTASTTAACASQYLDVWQNTGLESHRELTLHGVFPITSAPIYATTTGPFNFTFDIIDSSVSVGATSTIYSLTPNQQFYAQLYQSTCGYDPFTGTGVAPVQLVSTTTSLVATTSTVIEGGINNNPFTGANYGNNSLPTSTDMLSFVNVPNLLATKVPFAYIFQVSTVIYNAVNGSTSASAIPSGSFSIKFPVKFGISGVATATTTIKIDMFSTSTIGYFLTPSYVGLLRGLMVAVTYFLTAWYLFHEARNRKLL